MWRKFRRHRIALVGGGVPLFLYLTTAVAGFSSLNKNATRDADYLLTLSQRVRLFHDGRLIGRFVYSLERTRDPETLQRTTPRTRTTRAASASSCAPTPTQRLLCAGLDVDSRPRKDAPPLVIELDQR